nr:putative nuclease HARBI1 [Crassostrea gigas]
MPPAMFYELLQRITPRIQKSERYRRPLEPGLKLAITLRYIVTGNSYKSLQYSFRVAHNTIALFIPEVCQAIIDEYQNEVFAFPTNQEEWREVAQKFGERWNFYHTCGALDGKHVAIRNPCRSGTLYYNYKGFFSIILLALVDANYKFLWAHVDPEPLPHDDRPTPYFLIGDDAFPLRSWMMKPYSNRNMNNKERIFNYRLSRARRVVENTFGILAHRWRCMLGTMQQDPDRVKLIVMAAICPHNLMRLRYPGLQNNDLDQVDEAGNYIPGAWRNDRVLQDVEAVGRGNLPNREGKKIRTYLKHYYNSGVGSLPCQQNMI